MSHITETMEHIRARLDVLTYFKSIIHDHKRFAYEVDHIQKCVESNLWLFGEQYHLLSTEEDKFERSLRNLLKFKGDEHFDKATVQHPDKNKEMDIFAAQKGKKVSDTGKEYFHNVVIELKRPSIKLSDKEFAQIRTYRNVIATNEEFNDGVSLWDFILVGNDISDSDYIAEDLKSAFQNSAVHCEPNLVQKTNNIRIYVKTWTQILNEFELRYHELSSRLQLKEAEIISSSPDALTEDVLAQVDS